MLDSSSHSKPVQCYPRYSVSDRPYSSKPQENVYVLLVEDDPIVQTVITMILTDQLGYRVDVVTSGEDAVETFSSQYDVVIMDIGLPGSDGIEAAQQIRHHHSEHPTPIIAHTAHGDDTLRKRCLAVGIDHYLTKGASTQVLAESIKKVLSRSVECC